MIVNATEFKASTGKFLDMVNKEEIIITKNGREVAKLIPIKKNGTPNADFLYGLLADNAKKEVTAKEIREERISDKYGNSD
jgi:prevent-host-death family protein